MNIVRTQIYLEVKDQIILVSGHRCLLKLRFAKQLYKNTNRVNIFHVSQLSCRVIDVFYIYIYDNI